MDGDRYPTPAQAFTDAVCASDDLSTTEAMVLLAYARAAKNGGDAAWLTQPRIMRECKICSRETVVRVRQSVTKKGWLTPVDAVVIRGGVATVYRMVIPPPGTTIEPGERQPGTVTEPGTTIEPGTPTEPGSAQPGTTIEPAPSTTIEPGQSTRYGERTGSREPGTTIEPGEPPTQYGDRTETVVTRYDPEPDPVRSADIPSRTIEPGISPQSETPHRGGLQSGVRAAARPRVGAREAAAPDGAAPRDHGPSTNGNLSPTAKDAIASMRSIPGRPSKKSPDVHGTPRTNPGGSDGPAA